MQLTLNKVVAFLCELLEVLGYPRNGTVTVPGTVLTLSSSRATSLLPNMLLLLGGLVAVILS